MIDRVSHICSVLLLIASANVGTAAEKASPFTISPKVSELLESYCFSCHDGETQKGDLRLDRLDALAPDARLDLLNKMQEHVFFREMPPKKKKQPSEAERDLLFRWISGELKQFGTSALEENLKKPEFGNYVDHEKLFSGENAHLKGFTRDRRWLISEFIFNAKINHLIDHPSIRTIDGVKRDVIGDNGVNISKRFGGHNLRQSITNPFLLPGNIGVRYYDTPR